MTGLCELCTGKMKEISRSTVKDTVFVIMKCEKCGHLVARSKD